MFAAKMIKAVQNRLKAAMMSETLYNTEILRLAVSIAGQQRLATPHGSAERRSAICGSRVTVDVRLDTAGHIAELGLEVKACALGQAAAALFAAHGAGRNLSELLVARAALTDYLAGMRADPGEWPGLELFAPARPHGARHASIRLVFEAAVAAVEAAQLQAKAA
jgi:NifU-like protein involved in Fe-S cluster formation